jgi:ferritin-like metal-binding protein YciE
MTRNISSAAKAAYKKSIATKAEPGKGHVKMIQLLEHYLKDLYYAEKKLTAVMPKIISQVDSEELREELEKHHAATAKQITTLESVFKAIEIKPRGRRCQGIEGLLKECNEVIAAFDQPMLDPAILTIVLKIEQYEITAYTSVIDLAKSLDLLRPAKVLSDILKEEKEAYKNLEDMVDLHVQRAYLWQVEFD